MITFPKKNRKVQRTDSVSVSGNDLFGEGHSRIRCPELQIYDKE